MAGAGTLCGTGTGPGGLRPARPAGTGRSRGRLGIPRPRGFEPRTARGFASRPAAPGRTGWDMRPPRRLASGPGRSGAVRFAPGRGGVMIRRFDLLILGGGIFGATAVWHAARRGLRVLLVERDDFGAGASSSSMKILHGGLRYLQTLHLRRSLESVRERRRLMRLAPDLVRLVPFQIDLRGRSALYRAALRAGLFVNDMLGRADAAMVRSHAAAPLRRPTAGLHSTAAGRPPAGTAPSDSPVWYEVQACDTERLLLNFLHAATRQEGGAVVCNHATARELRREGGAYRAAVPGAGEVAAGAVLRCTGPRRRPGGTVVSLNLLFDELPLNRGGSALALRHPRDGRNLFCVPWRGRTIAGTYDRVYPYPPDEPFRLDGEWIDETLAWLRAAHGDLAPLNRRDVRFVHAGILPGRGGGTAPAARDRVERLEDGSWAVEGVKWTTACAVTERAVERAVRDLDAPPPPPAAEEPLPDTEHERDQWCRAAAGGDARVGPPEAGLHRGEILFAVRREWARTLADVLLRRTGTASAGYPGDELVAAAADVLQAELGWSPEERRAQVAAFDGDFHFGRA
ncbi:MAG: FAD-dependent oxidoreductase [Candidatus Eisenbacteria bacterium]|nr:FAD-dependent oxidoreductase [Candidatus Eisenbacteria bacterium]